MNFTYTKGWAEQYFNYFFAGETLSQVQSTNNWYNLTYNLILNESTLSLTCFMSCLKLAFSSFMFW